MQNGDPPDFDGTEIREGYDGFTHGIVVDLNSQVTLGPVSGFVVVGACYRITLPSNLSPYRVIPLTITSDIGDPPIEALITQGGADKYASAKNLTIYVYSGGLVQGYCNLGRSWSEGCSTQGERPEGAREPEADSALETDEGGARPEAGGSGEEFATDRIAFAQGPSLELEPNEECRHVRFNGGTAQVPAGKFVVFSSKATNLGFLTPDDTFQVYRLEYLDAGGWDIELVSVNEAGVALAQHSLHPSISDDGTKVVFDSKAALVSIDLPNDIEDIYLRDMAAQETRVLSYRWQDWTDPQSPWTCSTQPSTLPCISGDGSYVAFTSQDPTLDGFHTFDDQYSLVYRVPSAGMPGFLPGTPTNIEMVSIGIDGAQPLGDISTAAPPELAGQPETSWVERVISGDGRFVVFQGYAPDWWAIPPNNSTRIYFRDMTMPEVVQQVAADDGLADCTNPSITAVPMTAGSLDYLVCFSGRMATWTGGVRSIFWNKYTDGGGGSFSFPDFPNDLVNDLFGGGGGSLTGVSDHPNFAPLGRFIAFSSNEEALGFPMQVDNVMSTFLAEIDLGQGTTVDPAWRVSIKGIPNPGGFTGANGESSSPDVVPVDGGRVRVAFESEATNLAASEEDEHDFRELFFREQASEIALFRRGNANADAAVNLTDAVFSLNALFLAGLKPPCIDAADADDKGNWNISDPIYTLNFLFLGGPAPPAPSSGGLGVDPTPDGLRCENKS